MVGCCRRIVVRFIHTCMGVTFDGRGGQQHHDRYNPTTVAQHNRVWKHHVTGTLYPYKDGSRWERTKPWEAVVVHG